MGQFESQHVGRLTAIIGLGTWSDILGRAQITDARRVPLSADMAIREGKW